MIGEERSEFDVRRFYLVHGGIALLIAAAVLALFEWTELDRTLSDQFFDPAQGIFPLRSNWFLQNVMHDWAKWLLIAFAGVMLGIAVVSFWNARLRSWRATCFYIALCMGVGPGVVGLLKDSSYKHCPWDLQIYGGYAPYKKLLEAPEPGVKCGKCFPGGHASGGFALMSLYLALYRRNRSWARWGLAIGFAYGFALGFARILQGAHFLSHNLWTAIVCWGVSLALYEIVLRRSDDRRAGESRTIAAARAPSSP